MTTSVSRTLASEVLAAALLVAGVFVRTRTVPVKS